MFILHVMCHELAHCEQMNHSAEFQRVSSHACGGVAASEGAADGVRARWDGQVNGEIKQEMFELRRRNYFGDGFWSAGTRECVLVCAPDQGTR